MRFRIGNTEISFSFWFFVVISLFALMNRDFVMPYIFLPVIVHEFGHFIAMAVCGAKIKSIRFTAFGVDMVKIYEASLCYGKEIAIAAAGAAANLAICLFLYLFCFHSVRTMLMIAANLTVALFNLLPVGSLDGGTLTRLLSERFFTLRFAFILSRVFSFLALIPLFAAAVFLLLMPERNFTLLIICVYLLLDIIFSD